MNGTGLSKVGIAHPTAEEMRSRLSALPLPLLEDLGEALLDFTTLADLEAWLEEHPITENDRP